MLKERDHDRKGTKVPATRKLTEIWQDDKKQKESLLSRNATSSFTTYGSLAMSGNDDSCKPYEPASSTIKVITASSKWLFALAVVGTTLIAVYLFAVGFLVTLSTIAESLASGQLNDMDTLNTFLAEFIKIIDIFLVATVFYIIALGFYELFIAKAPLPGWLKICDLDDLKTKLLGLVIIALAVVMLGEALTWDGTANILSFGIAIAAGIIAISAYIWVKH
jgi:uncharacterized membrane protein YqhA